MKTPYFDVEDKDSEGVTGQLRRIRIGRGKLFCVGSRKNTRWLISHYTMYQDAEQLKVKEIEEATKDFCCRWMLYSEIAPVWYIENTISGTLSWLKHIKAIENFFAGKLKSK